MNIINSRLKSNNDAPMDLLLLADPSEELIKDYLMSGFCYTANIDKEIIGIAVILEIDSNIFEIKNIVVKEEFQGRGIGKQLLLYVINELKAKTIYIGTGNSSVYQLLLYQKCGFRIVEVEPDFFRKNYPNRIYENGIECRDLIRLKIEG